MSEDVRTTDAHPPQHFLKIWKGTIEEGDCFITNDPYEVQVRCLPFHNSQRMNETVGRNIPPQRYARHAAGVSRREARRMDRQPRFVCYLYVLCSRLIASCTGHFTECVDASDLPHPLISSIHKRWRAEPWLPPNKWAVHIRGRHPDPSLEAVR
jgi:hypothetical protein